MRALPANRRDSPLHRAEQLELSALEGVRAGDRLTAVELAGVTEATPLAGLLRRADALDRQEVLPVLGADGALRGVIDADAQRVAGESRDLGWAVAADLMGPAASVSPADTLRPWRPSWPAPARGRCPSWRAGGWRASWAWDDVARALLARAGEESPPGPVGA